METSLSVLRAQYADQRIYTVRFPSLAHWNPIGGTQPDANELKRLKDYRSTIRSVPVDLRQQGLLQVAAFLLSKSGSGEKEVLQEMLLWLAESPATAWCFGGDLAAFRAAVDAFNSNAAVHLLVTRGSLDLALMERELGAVLELLRRFAEGLWNFLEDNRRPNPPEHEE